MTIARLPWYAVAIALVLISAYGLAVLGLTLCSPAPLTGDEAWAWSMRLRESVGTLFGYEARCFYQDQTMAGAWSVSFASWGGWAALAVAVVAGLWETLGRQLRNAMRRRRGRHAILAGEPGEIDSLAAAARNAKPVVYLARNRRAGLAIARQHPFAEVAVLGDDRREARRAMQRLGAAKAALIAAVTSNDLANGELADAALAEGGAGGMIVRLEQTSVRALKSDSLRRNAEKLKRKLTVVSLRQMQARAGLGEAMLGRYRDDRAKRVHIAVCGAGPLLQEVTFLTVRQGYGLESAAPLVSILRTGRSDFAAGALELLGQSGVAEVRRAEADGSDGVAIDRAFTAIALAEGMPLAAVHCCEEEEGAAVELAKRLERVMVDLDISVPPIAVHGQGREAEGATGMIRVVCPTDLARAHYQSAQLDRRARAFHEAYLEGQRKERGSAYGSLPAERDWEQLSESLRDDNRNSADHIDYKLAAIGFVAVQRSTPSSITETDIEALARMEHARWMASRGLRGYRYGPVRDDRQLFHPDMKPYDELDADAQRKDRDQVLRISSELASAGEVPARLRSRALLSAKGIDGILKRMKPATRGRVLEWPMVAVALDRAEGISIAERALAAGFLIEVFVSRMPEHIFSKGELRRRAAAVLRQAWHIRMIRDGTASEALAAKCVVVVDAEGRLDETVLA